MTGEALIQAVHEALASMDGHVESRVIVHERGDIEVALEDGTEFYVSIERA